MVTGITTFAKSIDQAIEDKVSADPGLKKQWEEVSTRFHLVYAQPESAFKAINVDAMLKDETAAKSTLATIGSNPEHFGALKGKTGMFASRARSRSERRLRPTRRRWPAISSAICASVPKPSASSRSRNAPFVEGVDRYSGALGKRKADPRTSARCDRPERPAGRSRICACR